ncbi:MAG: DUF5683 domain-containing protein [Candidatus Neomarinimicrobiota bacterium]|jgi:hypothetical protein|nr:DUF5683 domain-containing protein [Candidatus Neomarinimicrobiota bacterium]
MFRLAKLLFFSLIIFSYLFSQQKVDFRTEEEQLKDPKVALKRSLTIPGAGQIYNDQKVKGYTLMAGEILALWSFNENRKKYNNYDDSYANSKEHYLRERNRFAWIAIGLYFYSVLDAVVEAHLDNFDEIVEESDPLNNNKEENEQQ